MDSNPKKYPGPKSQTSAKDEPKVAKQALAESAKPDPASQPEPKKVKVDNEKISVLREPFMNFFANGTRGHMRYYSPEAFARDYANITGKTYEEAAKELGEYSPTEGTGELANKR